MTAEEAAASAIETPPVVSVVDLAKRWDASSGLAPVTFTLHRGEVLVVRGRSGTGKSTLLSLLAGWCRADSGEIRRHEPLGSGDTWSRWDRTALVPQVLGLLPELSVLENVALAARDRAGSARQAQVLAAEALERLDAAALARRSPAETSMGQQQRVAVARAIVARPVLLLVDEPTSHQDDGHSATVVTALAAAVDDGSAAVVVTHDPRVVLARAQVLTLSTLEP